MFLTNTITSFQETRVFKTGLSDFHKLVVTVLKSTFPKSLLNRSYKNFSNNLLRDYLNSLLSKENMTLEFTSLTSITKIFIEPLNQQLPQKLLIIGSFGKL